MAGDAPAGPGRGGAGGRFPTTHLSAVAGAAADDPALRARSLDTLIAAYWKPVYKYIRVKWGKPHEDARDLTQGFFTLAMEKEFFASFNPSRGRFRTFLRTCLDGFLSNEEKAGRRIKRGGDVVLLPLEFETAEGEVLAAGIPSGEDPERYFDAEWVRHLLGLAVEALRADCEARGRQIHFRLFERYDLEAAGEAGPERATYAELAAEAGLPVTTVTNHLALARREFRRILLEKLREITATDEEYRREARYLLGTDPP